MKKTMILAVTALVAVLMFVACDMSGNQNEEETGDITAEGSTLQAQLDWLRGNAQSGRQHIVNIGTGESIAPQSLVFGGRTVTIILRGSGEISLAENGSLFSVGSGVTLRLDGNITLRGRDQNNAPLVLVEQGGTFVMEEGVVTGNINTGSLGGGGVRVNGNFTMNGGSVYDNRSAYGGGVSVVYGAIFAMHGGEIIGNTATIVDWTGGGGVNVAGTFNMHGGSISGNTSVFIANAPGVTNPNIQARAGGVFVGNTGTFTMHSGEIYSNTASSATTGAGGGGVFIDCGNARGGVFNMRGGSIHDNISSGGPWSQGGGVSVNGYHDYGGTFRISGGIVSGSNRHMTVLVYGTAVAEYGTFNAAGVFNRTGELPTGSIFDTLEVVNGVMVEQPMAAIR